MTDAFSSLTTAVDLLIGSQLSCRNVARRASLPEDEIRRIARRLVRLGLARDEIAKLSGHELHRLLRRQRQRACHHRVLRGSRGAA